MDYWEEAGVLVQDHRLWIANRPSTRGEVEGRTEIFTTPLTSSNYEISYTMKPRNHEKVLAMVTADASK